MKKLLAGALALALAGCGQAPDAPAVTSEAPAATDQAPRPLPELPSDDADLQALADAAMRDKHLFAPAGSSAMEYFLALRERPGQTQSAATALVQLQPYLTLAIESALQGGDLVEAERLTALLVRADPMAPALPRLRDAAVALRGAQQQALAAEQASAAAEAARVAAARQDAAAARQAPAAASAAPAAVVEPLRTATAPVAAPAAPPPAAVRVVAEAPPPRAARRQPQLLADVAPRYPLPALRGRIEGEVELAFAVTSDGSVRDVRVVSAQPAGVFDASALAVAPRWQFEATGEQHTIRRVLRYRLPAGS